MKRYVSNVLDRVDSARVDYAYSDVMCFSDWTNYVPFFSGNGAFGACVDKYGMIDSIDVMPVNCQ